MPIRFTRALPPMVCALVPAVAVFLLVPAYFGRSLLSFTPVWSDEIDYWREIYTFGHVGFGGGYYAINEVTPPAAFSHFGAHGPAFPVLFGSLSALTGWGIAYGPLFNLAFLVGATLVYFWLVRPNSGQMILATLSVLVFWPILLYIPSSMQETVHQALAVLLAGVFYVMIRRRDQIPASVFVLGIVALAVASLLRPTWAPLFIPLFLLRARMTSWRNALWATLLTIPIMLVSFAASAWLSSPYPNFLSNLQKTTQHSLRAGAHLFLTHLWTNLELLFLGGEPLERGLRYQLLAALAIAIGFLGYHIYRRRQGATKTGEFDNLSLLHVLNIVPVLIISLALYDILDWRDFRVFAPHVLLAIMVSIPFSRRSFVLVPLALNLLLTVSFVPTFRTFHEMHFATGTYPRSPIAGAVRYQPGADPWRNTVLVDQANYTAALLQLPPGIGVSVILAPSDLKTPIKSEYLLVSDDTMKVLGNPAGWDPTATTPYGKLYVQERSQTASP